MRGPSLTFTFAFALGNLCLGAACSEHGNDVGYPIDGGAVPDAGGSGADAAPAVMAAGAALTFESGPVRPLALSPDGSRVFVANLPDGRLEVLRVTAGGLLPVASVPVGVDPVAVATRGDGEVWVVNHVSDSVSVVDVAADPPRVVRTLLVGDEPQDIVFANGRAFITTAHRGQQRQSPDLAGVPGAGDPELATAGRGRADVWVFDPADLGAAAGGRPVAIVTLRGDKPRGLAVAADGKTVYAAILHSGNQTTVTSPLLPCAGFDKDTPCTVQGVTVPGSPPGPATNHEGIAAPRVGVMLKADGAGAWRDVKGRDWSAAVKFKLPDEDVFAIDAASLQISRAVAHVGTTLFNLAVNPKSGKIYVSNTEARNDLRFEGPGTFAGTTLMGHLAESRITVIDADGPHPRRLNKHIDYAARPAPAGVKEHSLATPLDMVVSSDGATLYVAAFGSGKIGVFSTAALEDDSFDPTKASAAYLTVSGGGPAGLALDEARGRIYVATRFDDGVSAIDLVSGGELAHLRLHDPEPAAIVAGRPFLYDATRSSSNGEAACASCHTFGDTDQLAWDLGNPDGDVVTNPILIKLGFASGGGINGTGSASQLHPMKGPMGTQTLRGMVNHGAMHWRGDRVDGFYGVDTRPAPPYDAELSFKNFIVAFDGLLGREALPADGDMGAFAAFALAIVIPPNPVRSLDNSLTERQARGKRYFMGCEGLDSIVGTPVVCVDGRPDGSGHFSDGAGVQNLGFTCEGCHTLDPARGFFGTNGQFSFEALPQIMKVPHLRNLYDKVGMFGQPGNGSENSGDNGFTGDQIRGFGFTNDASVDTLFRFLQARVFNAAQGGRVGFTGGDEQRRAVEDYLLAFDNDLAPIVGHQVTLGAALPSAAARVDLLVARARTPFTSKVLGGTVTECDLVAHGVIGGAPATYLLRADGMFAPTGGGAAVSDGALRLLAAMPGQAMTYTCLPPGWGGREASRTMKRPGLASAKPSGR